MIRAIVRRLRRRVALGGPKVRGAVDGIDALGLHGWATARRGPARVEVRSGERVVAAVDATTPRPDVAAAGAGPLGCGFRLPMAGLAEAALKAGASPEDAPLRLTVNGVEMASALQSLRPDGLVEADALAWFAREAKP